MAILIISVPLMLLEITLIFLYIFMRMKQIGSLIHRKMVLQVSKLPPVRNKKADYLITEEGMMEVGSFKFEVRHTPGHSPGSVSFIFAEDQFAVVGDTLFRGSVGRTDLPDGDTSYFWLRFIISYLIT